MKRNKASYVGGAAALLVSSVTVKILGALFKIPLTNLIGDSGMGLFAFAMQFFSLLFVISAAGIPAAEAHLVSEALAFGRRQQAKAIAVRAGNVFTVTSALLSLALAGAAPTVCRAFGQTDAVPCLLTIAPAVFLVTIEAVLRGWYQGTGNMVPTAVSQVAEAAGKLTVGLAAAGYLLRAGYGITGAAAGAVFGVTCGELLAVLYLIWRVRRGVIHMLRHSPEQSSDFSKLVQLMIPVTLGAAVMTISGFLDMAVVYRRLPAAGFSVQEIVAAYGAYTGMALTLFNLPQALSNAVSVSVLPVLSAAAVVVHGVDAACVFAVRNRAVCTGAAAAADFVCVSSARNTDGNAAAASAGHRRAAGGIVNGNSLCFTGIWQTGFVGLRDDSSLFGKIRRGLLSGRTAECQYIGASNWNAGVLWYFAADESRIYRTCAAAKKIERKGNHISWILNIKNSTILRICCRLCGFCAAMRAVCGIASKIITAFAATSLRRHMRSVRQLTTKMSSCSKRNWEMSCFRWFFTRQ